MPIAGFLLEFAGVKEMGKKIPVDNKTEMSTQIFPVSIRNYTASVYKGNQSKE